MKTLLVLLTITILFTGCVFERTDLLETIEDMVEEEKEIEDLEIDQTVYERELPPYFDDDENGGR